MGVLLEEFSELGGVLEGFADFSPERRVSTGEARESGLEVLDRDRAGESAGVEHREKREHLVALRHRGDFEVLQEIPGGRALEHRGHITHRLHEAEPGSVGLRDGPRRVAGVVDFEGGRSRLVALAEALVPGPDSVDGVGLFRDSEESPENIDRLELVGDFAARR